jgi:formylglycine-generating enzyme required for sulfatase activity
MALVAGSYCPNIEQTCLEQPNVLGGEGYHQCRRFAEARCLSKSRAPMRFCMDRFEWPSERGALPRTLTSWPEAKALCESKGKRLCTMDEFNFACEGEAMNAFVYGNVRDATACNFDRPYIERTFNYARWDACMEDPTCKAEFERLDQRVPAGSLPRCVSPQGVYDLNGNVNEWVVRTDQRAPNRSGLKGGWWGPVRDRCRPMTTFHLEGDYGYEAGFRCCKDTD